ncbi:MAG: hypothetical protein P8Z49_00705 [Acidobacteriota bacterium]|jgi:hypothetical protein
MKRTEYLERLRIRLIEVPVEERQTWSVQEFVEWWLHEQKKDKALRWDDEPDNSFIHVRGACRDLIGPEAGA